MKKKRSKIFFVSLFIIVILLLGSYSIIQSNYDRFELLAFKGPTAIVPPIETRSPNCVAYPSIKEDLKLRTATPYQAGKSNASSAVTVTPLPISHTVDLSTKAQESEKTVITIFRCNGTFDQYIVGIDIKVPEDLHLGVGDTIYSSIPLGLHSVPPPSPFMTVTNPPISTNVPILTITSSIEPTIAPYPVPIITKTIDLDRNKLQISPYPAP